MTFQQLFVGQITLARAVRHLSNRAAHAPDGVLKCDGPVRDAIDLMNGLHGELQKEFRARQRMLRPRRKKAAA